jgi:hypothetical protein
MAVGCDRADYLQRVMTGDLQIAQDVITVLGLWYVGKKVVEFSCDVYVGFRNFIWARIYPVSRCPLTFESKTTD